MEKARHALALRETEFDPMGLLSWKYLDTFGIFDALHARRVAERSILNVRKLECFES